MKNLALRMNTVKTRVMVIVPGKCHPVSEALSKGRLMETLRQTCGTLSLLANQIRLQYKTPHVVGKSSEGSMKRLVPLLVSAVFLCFAEL